MTEWYRMKNNNINKNNSTELSVDVSGSEVSDSFNLFSDNLSPIAAIVPRKLDFTHMDDGDGIRDASPAPAPLSPPYKRVRALRLFDSPHTPKSLLEKCSTPSHHPPRTRLFPPKQAAPSGIPSGSSHHLHPPNALTQSRDDSALGSLPPDDSEERSRRHANINPFTPDGQALNKKKRSLSKTPTWGDSLTPEQPAKRLRESNISRYRLEFTELGVLGRGQFGSVTLCLHKLDGVVYAVKRSLRPVAGSAAERAALTEVYAHAALTHHPRLLRYYSAWAEDDHMIIQNEYCDGGSLQQLIDSSGPLPESELLLILANVADGLAYIHSHQLVHMDVKPANLFISSGDATDSDDGYDDDDTHDTHGRSYKIGDLGHVTCLSSPHVEEGDCRYLPKEVLQENFTHLTKADIFALGLTLFEAGGGGPLPKNGPLWHAYRDGGLPDLPHVSREFNMLLKKMVHPDPTSRPSATRLKRHSLLQRTEPGRESKTQLRRELAAANMRNQLLETKLQEAARCIKSLTPTLVSDSAKFRTRSGKRLQKPRIDQQLQEMLKSVTTPVLLPRVNKQKKV